MFVSQENQYPDEIEDLGDLAQMVCALLLSSSVKNELWEIFEDLLNDDAFDGLESVFKYWKEEQSI